MARRLKPIRGSDLIDLSYPEEPIELISIIKVNQVAPYALTYCDHCPVHKCLTVVDDHICGLTEMKAYSSRTRWFWTSSPDAPRIQKSVRTPRSKCSQMQLTRMHLLMAEGWAVV
jgi:hypothetical protein